MLDTTLVAAIENAASWNALGAPVFAKGYLLRYARLLGGVGSVSVRTIPSV